MNLFPLVIVPAFYSIIIIFLILIQFECSVSSLAQLILVIFAGIWKVKVLVHKNYSAKEIEGNVRGTKESILNS